MINANNYPDITTMNLEEAKRYLLDMTRHPGDTHDVDLEGVCRVLVEAANARREAQAVLSGSRQRTYYSSGSGPDNKYTAVLYDAAWELVREGVLRPGPRFFGCLNERSSGFCLTSHGRATLQH